MLKSRKRELTLTCQCCGGAIDKDVERDTGQAKVCFICLEVLLTIRVEQDAREILKTKGKADEV